MEGQNKALIIVDVQNDFCEGGSLAVNGASEIIQKINGIRDQFQSVFLSSDWHPIDHVSFYTNHQDSKPFTTIQLQPGILQELWPVHCVQETEGAQFHKDLLIKESDVIIRKGMHKDFDSYSAFGSCGKETELHEKLQTLKIKDVYVVGLALDFCVMKTAFSAFELGYVVKVVLDCTKSIIDIKAAQTKIYMELEKIQQQNPGLQPQNFQLITSEQISK